MAILLAIALFAAPLVGRAQGADQGARGHKDSGVALFSRGLQSQALKEFDKALSLYRAAGETSGPAYADALQWKARVLSESGQTAEAVAVLAEAIKATPLSPMWSWTVVHRTELLDKIGKKTESSSVFESSIDLCRRTPDCSELTMVILAFGQARHDMEVKRPEQAHEDLGPALRYFLKHGGAPTDRECVDVIALAGVTADLLGRLDDWKDAQSVAQAGQSASSCAPSDQHSMEILLRLGEVNAACGRGIQARLLWGQALSGFDQIHDADGAQQARDLINNPGLWPRAKTPCESKWPWSGWRWP